MKLYMKLFIKIKEINKKNFEVEKNTKKGI